MAPCLVQGGNTAASAIFGGAVRSEIKAKSQQAKPSANVEAFTLLTLNISEPRVKDLESAITAFTAPETLDGELMPIVALQCNEILKQYQSISKARTKSPQSH